MAGGPTRRALLAASAAAVPILISGCRGVQVLGPPPPPAPQVRLLRAAVIAEQLMVSRYHAILAGPAANAAAAAKLAGLLAEHEQHLAQLKSRLIIPPGSAQSRGLEAVGSGGQQTSVDSAMFSIGGRYYTSDTDFSPYIGGGLSWEFLSLQAADFNGNNSGLGAYADAGFEVLRTHHTHLALGLRLDLPFFALNGSTNEVYNASTGTYTTPPSSTFYYAPVSLEMRLTF